MKYVWLKYIWDSESEVITESNFDEKWNEITWKHTIVDPKIAIVIKTTDWKNFEQWHKITVKKWDIFLCNLKNAKQYIHKDIYFAEWDEENREYNFRWAEETLPTKEEKITYYEMWKIFETKRTALLQYLYEEFKDKIFLEQIRTIYIYPSSLFNRILLKYPKYIYPPKKVKWIDISDILEYWEDKWYIYFYMENKDKLKISIKDDFFQMSDIKRIIEKRKKESKKIAIKDIIKNKTNIEEYIKFDLHNRTLEVGNLKGERKIRNIDKIPEELKILGKNIPTSIMLLYWIVTNAKENKNFIIKEKFNDYKEYTEKYKIQTWFKTRWKLSDFKTYISKVRKILELAWSEYNITTWKNPQILKSIKK